MTNKHLHNYIPFNKGLRCSDNDCNNFLNIGQVAAKINLIETVIHKTEIDINKRLKSICDYLVKFGD